MTGAHVTAHAADAVSVDPLVQAPFDLLSPVERARLREACDEFAFPAGGALQAPSGRRDAAWLVLSGRARQADGFDASAEYAPGELAGLRGLLAGDDAGSLVALERLIAIRIPKPTLQALIAANPAFAAELFDDLAQRLRAGARRGRNRERRSMMSKVREAWLRKPLFVDGATDLVTVCRILTESRRTEALVRDAGRLGIFTTTDLREAVLRPAPTERQPVRELAHFEPFSVQAESALLEAMQTMLRHRVHRVVVRDGERVVGVLGQLELMSFVSNHSHLIALQIAQAREIADLRDAALRIDELIESLHGDGVRVEVISGLVRELNRSLLAQLWTLIAPPALRENSCLVVMGSEGRGEQIVKTDQDNALLLRDGFDFEGLGALAERFSESLGRFGYPPCPGGIMVGNPLWCQPLMRFRAQLERWVHGTDPEGPMNLAIFLDATAVAGATELLGQARDHVDRILLDTDLFYARFASAIDRFGEPDGWWMRWAKSLVQGETEVDLKKLGIFPVVHGARALALQYRVREPGTVARLRVLATQGRIEGALVRDLVDALHFLMGLKLRSNLQQRGAGQSPDNRLRLSALGTLERDALHDALAIVRRFRQWLRLHYRLDVLR